MILIGSTQVGLMNGWEVSMSEVLQKYAEEYTAVSQLTAAIALYEKAMEKWERAAARATYLSGIKPDCADMAKKSADDCYLNCGSAAAHVYKMRNAVRYPNATALVH